MEEEIIKNDDEKFTIIQNCGRLAAAGYYDHQKTRIGATNRLRDIIRKHVENINTSTPEKKKEEKKYENKYNDKELGALLIELVKDKKLSSEEKEYLQDTLKLMEDTKKLEIKYKDFMLQYIETEPIWNEFLKDVKGISGVLASNIIKEFKYCEDSPHASSLLKYCGQHVVNGKAPKREKGKKLDFNMKLMKLCYNIGDSFIKQRTPVYREVYDAEKKRQLSLMEHAICENCGKTSDTHIPEGRNHKCKVKKGEPKTMFKFSKYYAPMNRQHCDLRARRKMMRTFLFHYWEKARIIRGLPVTKPFPFEKLGHDIRHYIKPLGD